MVFKIKVVYSLQRHLVAGRSNGCVVPILFSLLSIEINQKLFVGKSSGGGGGGGLAKLLEGDTPCTAHRAISKK